MTLQITNCFDKYIKSSILVNVNTSSDHVPMWAWPSYYKKWRTPTNDC